MPRKRQEPEDEVVAVLSIGDPVPDDRRMSLIIEEYHNGGIRGMSRYAHELKDVGHILWFCHYILRQSDNADMAAAAKRLSEQYVDDLLEHMRRTWPPEASEKPKMSWEPD
jgi:hypothetical protein